VSADVIRRMGESSSIRAVGVRADVRAMARMITHAPARCGAAWRQRHDGNNDTVATAADGNAVATPGGMRRFRALAAVLAVLIGGCTTARISSDSPAASPAVSVPTTTPTPEQRVVAYPHGSWLLFGDGVPGSPYRWVWLPRTASPPSGSPAR